MFRELHIDNFRSFRHFRMRELGTINLLVGGNNSGKTSILEALDLLLTHGEPHSIWSALNRRGERLWDDEDGQRSSEADVCRLFHGYEFNSESQFKISAKNGNRSQQLVASISEADEDIDQDLFYPEDDSSYGALALLLRWEGAFAEEHAPPIPLTERGGLSLDTLRRKRTLPTREETQPASFVTTAAMSPSEVVSLLSRIVLNPEEDLLLRALRIIEPSVERIAPIAVTSRRLGSTPASSKGGVVVKCEGIENRLPIGTMGDGVWRLLGIAIALIKARNGILLVDEVDTGLHYSVMNGMWKLIFETANRLNIQVFATTHSNDCWESLAAISESLSANPDDICLHRIESNKETSVRLDAKEMRIAFKRELEIR